MTLIQQLVASDNLKFFGDYKRGSVLDLSASPLAAPSVGVRPSWAMTSGGYGIVNRTYPSGLNYGVAAKCDSPNVGSLWCGFRYDISPTTGNYFWIVAKADFATITNGYYLYMSSANLGSSVRPAAGGSSTAYAISNLKYGRMYHVLFTWQNGGRHRQYVNGVRVDDQASSTATSAGENLEVGNWAPGAYQTFFPIVQVGIANVQLTDAQASQLYDEWLREAFVAKLQRRNFSLPYPTLTPAQYTARSTFLDATMQRQANRIDNGAPTAYSPTVVGQFDTVREAVFEVGQRIDANYAGVGISCGDVTQYNGATVCTTACWVKFPSAGVVSGRCIWGKHDYIATGHRMICQIMTASPGPHSVSYYEQFAAGNATANSPAILRPGVWHHIVLVRDGNGATDADKIKVYIDGVLQALAFPGPNNFPATLSANLAGMDFVLANASPLAAGGTSQACCLAGTRCEARAWSQADVTADYVVGASKPVFSHDLSDCPVMLGATSGAGPIGMSEWEAVSGTWTITEDATTGQKFLTCVTAGIAIARLRQITGNWIFDLYKDSGGATAPLVLVTAQVQGNSTATGQNGYWVQFTANEAVAFGRSVAGVSASLLSSSDSFIAAGTKYQLWLSRTAAGVNTLYIRGGALGTLWGLVPAAAGSNPVTDTNTFTGGYMVCVFGAGDKLGVSEVLP